MKRKIIISLMIVLLIMITGCNSKKEFEKSSKQNEKQTISVKKKNTTNNKIGNLSFYIPDTLRLNGTSTETTKAYEIYKDDTNITVWFSQKKEISEDIIEYMKNDGVDTEKLDKVNYNGHEWYVVSHGEFRLYTKYNNDVYKIRFSVLTDGSNMVSTLKRVIPKSLIFE